MSLESPEDVGRGGWVFDRWKYGSSFSWWYLVELFDVGVVAETVGPPAGNEVHAITLHFIQELPSAVGGAGELGRFFSFVFGLRGLILRGYRDGWN